MYLFQMQIVGKHYSQETSFQVRFGRSKISLDIPEDGKVTKEGWRITPSTHPTVSDTEHCIQELLLSSFAKEDDIEVHLYTLPYAVVLFLIFGQVIFLDYRSKLLV